MTPMPIRRRIAPLADGVLPVAATVAMLCALACVFLWVPSACRGRSSASSTST
jgi:hypothetical protein